MADEDKLIEGHDYDGIQEYDNDLPVWWKNIFIVTTIFALGYIVYRHFGIAEPVPDKLARLLSELESRRAQETSTQGTQTAAAVPLLELVSKSENITAGKGIFDKHCIACHGPTGGGTIGPNLTDKYWIHGGSVEEIKHTIAEGVIEKGMVPWKNSLKSSELTAVTAYIWSLKGTNPANAKAPEGDLVE